jgi:DNA-binding MarR family transcriptional regulator
MEQVELEQYIDQLQQVFLLAVRKMGKDITVGSDEVTQAQFYILQLLKNEGRCTVTQLAERLTVKPSAITAMIDRLIKLSYVTRERDEKDRRVVFIQLSDAGKQILQEASEKRKKILCKYFAHLEREELESLVAIFTKLSQVDTDH